MPRYYICMHMHEKLPFIISAQCLHDVSIVTTLKVVEYKKSPILIVFYFMYFFSFTIVFICIYIQNIVLNVFLNFHDFIIIFRVGILRHEQSSTLLCSYCYRSDKMILTLVNLLKKTYFQTRYTAL